MSSVSFDPVSHMYDITRGYPEEVARQLAQKIDRAVEGNAQTRFLEIGIGTGRIAFPLTELGRQYTGIDISRKMLSRLEEKLLTAGWQQEAPLGWGSEPDEDAARQSDVQRFVQREKQGAMRLAVSDMTAIPFHDHTFDVVVAVHVFHLISDWQKALEEVVRVLRPGGLLVRSWDEDWEEFWAPGSDDIRKQWCKIVQDLGGSTARPGAGDQAVTTWLQQRGFEVAQVDAVTWEQQLTPRALFQGVEQRLWTSTMFVPDTIFAASLKQLRQWVDERYGTTIDSPYVQQQRIVINRARLLR
ncbi:MAG TPA: class I SAM-dependent methyltransferase [Ktedonobacteraceae bacterium]|nr:class I SAM-dependent methyltransferase [Ktedonobacteraceae bacterium]